MNWIESIKEIRTAQANNRLVIFVGAGVSMNSKLPSWFSLIKSIAVKIGYNHSEKCASCERKSEECPKEDCEDIYRFTQDEFLRIPEYYYQQVKDSNPEEYYQHISETLKAKSASNPIDDVVFQILPHHIVTTNYDSLLEDSFDVNSNLYQVISQDSDLLSKHNDRYIIKMHGDLSMPETIVLKESDYIDYEQEHPLISTFIKSLLVNHSFLFIGYSLNDYNLNLIIGWINYFQKKYKVENRPKSFLIVPEISTEFEQIRQKSKNIYIVELGKIPMEICDKAIESKKLSDNSAKLLYSYLYAIKDNIILNDYIPFESVLEKSYTVLNSYNKIAYMDLIKTCSPGKVYFAADRMIFYEEAEFKRMEEIINSGNQSIINTFRKAGIAAIHSFTDDSVCRIPEETIDFNKIFNSYMDNDYLSIKKGLANSIDAAEKTYYMHFIGATTSEIEEAAMESYQNISDDDFISVLICKIRERLVKLTFLDGQEKLTQEIAYLINHAPAKYRNSILHLKMLFESSADSMVEMQKVLEKQRKRNEYGHTSFESGHAFTHIWKLQAYAYDYYFFFKCNFLPLDYYTETYQYFSYYVQSILCSYIPVEEKQEEFFGKTDQRHYLLNEIDLDIMVKYTKSKELSSWLKEYHVQNLGVENTFDCIVKFSNLCESFSEIKNRHWVDQIINFTTILCLVRLCEDDKKKALESFVNCFEIISQLKSTYKEELFLNLIHMVNEMSDALSERIQKKLLNIVLKDEFSDAISLQYESQYERLLKRIGSVIDSDIQKEQIDGIKSIEDSNKRNKAIHLKRYVLPKEWIKKTIDTCGGQIDTEELFDYIVEGYIDFSPTLANHFIDNIGEMVFERKKNPGKRVFPDWLSIAIENVIILKLLGHDVDIQKLESYKEYSIHLQFMLNPDQFDYSKVDINNYMWENLIYSDDYGKYFIENKETLLSDSLKTVFNLRLDTTAQQKVVYGLLLSKDELRKFGR